MQSSMMRLVVTYANKTENARTGWFAGLAAASAAAADRDIQRVQLAGRLLNVNNQIQ
jgi:hypothetical protein